MKINSIPVGELRCNCYLLEQNGEALLIDPGDELEKIEQFIKDKNVIAILLTHHHFDHVGCVKSLTDKYHYPVYEAQNLSEGTHCISTFCFEVIKTPGHTMDSITYYFSKDKVMFTGDFLFYHTIGRCDLEGSDPQKMLQSIQKIKTYSNDIQIYPGHGKTTILGEEKKNNPYFQEEYSFD